MFIIKLKDSFIYKISELRVFKYIKPFSEIYNKLLNDLLGTSLNKTLESC